MFNKPALFPKTSDATLPRTLRPGGGSTGFTPGTSASQSAQTSTVGSHGSTSAPPQREDSPQSGTTRSEALEPSPTQGSRLIVGPDVKLRGAEILDCDTLVVEGRVEATMDSRVLRIAENGAFAGTVSIDVAEIHGLFEGELTARERLVVHATGRINGKIRYGKIHIEEGGELSGDIKSLAAAGRDATRDTPRTGERKDDTRPLAAIAG
ncbi:MAG: polymer-forming cytoskeletal protein [Methyloversatilis sp.]|nr:polymer-forming cytoskeletal protein [Methyloversatilis sp.]